MSAMSGVLEGFTTIGALIALGALLAHLRVFDLSAQVVLSRLAFYVASPALMITVLQDADVSAVLSRNLVATGCAVVTVVLLYVVVARLVLRQDLADTVVGALCSAYVNAGNLGLPLALFAFGETGLSYAVVVFAVMAIWSFTYGIWIVSGGGSLTKALKEPLVWGTVLGGIFLWQGWQTPPFLTNTLELIGQMAIPLMLITLGVAVARLSPGNLVAAIGMSVVKLVLCVAIAWGVGRMFALDDVAFAVLVLQIATPVAVTSYLLAEKYGADAQSVAGLVVVSTLLSVLAIPVILAVLL